MIEESSLCIVDRNTSSRQALSRLILAAGYTVHSFERITDFFKMDIKEMCSCLILDLDVPEMPIEELKTILEVQYENLMVFVISSDDKQEIRDKAFLIGAKGYFRKPVDGKALIDSINWITKIKD